ncbi:mdm2-binding protein-like isoform X2 [Rhopilema esculentum]|uniref:mdm2-binding protein-like isoform X2 n=1 Tax=Rhopilema esculentum TaxID=499914 RepID=UPI0031D8E707
MLTACLDSSFLTGITSVQKTYVAFYSFDSLKGGLELPKCQWNSISSQFINEELNDGNLILYLLWEYAKEFQESKCAETRSNPTISNDPVDHLHELADKLPIEGSYILEVILVESGSDMLHPEDCLSFYGYLKRLELWHNARINFFDIDELVLESGGTKNSLAMEIWKDAIRIGRIKKSCKSMTLRPSILWNGDMILRNENGCHTCVPGFELRSNANFQACVSLQDTDADGVQRLLINNEIEVLQAIECHEVPLHVCCAHKLRLTAKEEREKSTDYFLNVIQKACQENICFLGCILYDLQKSRNQSDQPLTTKKWFDYVNDKNTEYLVPKDLKKVMPKRCMVVIKGSEYGDDVDVIFLKDLDCFNGSSLYSFLCDEHSLSKNTEFFEPNFKWKLAIITDGDILKADLKFHERLCRSLEVPDPETEESDLFLSFSEKTEKEYIRDFHLNDGEEIAMEYHAAKVLSPSLWPERLAWSNQETSASALIKGSLKRFQSAEGHMKLKGIPVSAESHYQDVTENFSQIQKLFDEFGGPANTEMKRIPLVADRLFKQLPPEDDVKNLPFSKATQFFGHGIDYCLDSHNSLKLDAKITRIQKRFISDDTSCTLTQIQRKGSRLKRVSKNGILSDENRQSRKKRSPQKPSKEKVQASQNKNNNTSNSKEKFEDDKKKVVKVKDSDVDDSTSTANKETRSQRHQRRLRIICEGTLQKYGKIDKKDPVFERCVTRLFTLCKSFLKDLKTSEGLTAEMKRIAKCNVLQVVEFEKRGN